MNACRRCDDRSWFGKWINLLFKFSCAFDYITEISSCLFFKSTNLVALKLQVAAADVSLLQLSLTHLVIYRFTVMFLRQLSCSVIFILSLQACSALDVIDSSFKIESNEHAVDNGSKMKKINMRVKTVLTGFILGLPLFLLVSVAVVDSTSVLSIFLPTTLLFLSDLPL